MLLTEVNDAPRLSPRAMEAYEKYCAIKEERSRVEARARELKKAQEAQEAIFSTQFDDLHTDRRIPGQKLLHCNKITIPQHTVKEYSYYKWSEVSL